MDILFCMIQDMEVYFLTQRFRDILEIDSTSGRERALAEWLLAHVEAPRAESFEVGDGTLNLLFSWGGPVTPDEAFALYGSKLDSAGVTGVE